MPVLFPAIESALEAGACGTLHGCDLVLTGVVSTVGWLIGWLVGWLDGWIARV
jgi:hypothetical protein